MGELRRFPAKAFVEDYVFRRRRNPFLKQASQISAIATIADGTHLPPHDVANLHEVIVHDVGEMVGRPAVGFQQDRVVHFRVLETDVSVNKIPKRSRPLGDLRREVKRGSWNAE